MHWKAAKVSGKNKLKEFELSLPDRGGTLKRDVWYIYTVNGMNPGDI